MRTPLAFSHATSSRPPLVLHLKKVMVGEDFAAVVGAEHTDEESGTTDGNDARATRHSTKRGFCSNRTQIALKSPCWEKRGRSALFVSLVLQISGRQSPRNQIHLNSSCINNQPYNHNKLTKTISLTPNYLHPLPR